LLFVRSGTRRDACWKQGYRSSCRERCARGCDGCCHQLSIRRDEVEFFAVGPPPRLGAAADGNLPFGRWFGKRLHDDFEPARFIRLICHPGTVRMKLAIEFFRRSVDD
jgi:hypothetical protein